MNTRQINKQDKVNTLVTSVSRKTPLVRELRNAYSRLNLSGEIYGGDSDERCIGRHFVDEFWIMPRINDLDIQEFIKYCLFHGITCVIPTRDGELPFFARHRGLLSAQGIHCMISSLSAVNDCLDKLSFFNRAMSFHVPTIPSTADIEQIHSHEGTHYVVKERYGSGSRKIGVDLDFSEAVSYASQLDCPIFQPFFKGNEISIDVYVDRKGVAKGAVARTRDLVINGESQVTTSFRDKPLEALCCSFAEQLGLYGHAVFQVIQDENGQNNFIECNSRFGGASTLSIAVGLDTFSWLLLEKVGVDLDTISFQRSEREKRQIRYTEDRIE